jgi:hypothetical protein
MMMDRRFGNDSTERSSINDEQNRTKNRTLGDTIKKLKDCRLRILGLNIE